MLIQKIKQDLVSHIKSGDKIKISITRLLIAALKDKEISLRNNQDFDELINDNIVMEIINKMIKQRKIAAQTYEEANRADLAEKELEEAKLLSHYLPSQLSEDQLNAKVEEIIKEVDAKSLRDMSKVMKVIKENLSGKCDMQMASNLVKSKLSE
ncbi:MAG: aspartyl-tRNA amidotransferase subunit B [Alphaproteobacteria bacterium]|nr:MAG: aspartyl-tRNA amidotransferase subunit B [Alphaproteobacteria bacterium]